MEWIKFEDKLPTNIVGAQVRILFVNPKWAGWFRGLYHHLADEPLRGRLFQYRDNDRYYAWKISQLPTHWMLSPEKPKI